MDEDILNIVDLRELGRELRSARRKRRLRQADAANIIDVARTTMTAIEKGERRIKPGELIKLARAYGRQVSDFVRPRPQIEPMGVYFRGPYLQTVEDVEEIHGSIDELEELCRDYLELEQITEAPLHYKYPPEYEIARLPTKQAAESVALEERNRLGFGDGPIPILRSVLEQDVGLRVFYLPLRPSNYSAIYYYDQQLGGCIGVNSLHPEERRRWSLAHDYALFSRPTASSRPYTLKEAIDVCQSASALRTASHSTS